jgi:hypothetical protein
MLVERRVISLTDAPIHAHAPTRRLLLHLPVTLEATLLLLLLSRLWSLVCFFINNTSIVVLFDSGASHSFISALSVEKYNLPLALLKCQMIVSSMGGDMPARQLCSKVYLKIRRVLAVLKPNRIIRKHTNANCSSFVIPRF